MTMQITKKRYTDLKAKFEAEKNKLDNSSKSQISMLFHEVDTCFKEFDDRKKGAEDKINMITTMMGALEKSKKDQVEKGLASVRDHLADIDQQISSRAESILDKIESLINVISTVNSKKQDVVDGKKLDLPELQTLLFNVQTKAVQFEKDLQSADHKQKAELLEKRNKFITETLQKLHEQSSLLAQCQFKNPLQETLKPIFAFSINAAILGLQEYQNKPIGNEAAVFTPAANAAASSGNNAAGAAMTAAASPAVSAPF